jgi:hypothetical protein
LQVKFTPGVFFSVARIPTSAHSANSILYSKIRVGGAGGERLTRRLPRRGAW